MTAGDPRNGRPYRRHRARVMANETHCWLCGEPVDKTLPRNHRMAGTADHITPVSLGGHPLGPMRLAHRACNSRRGNGQPQRPPTRHSREW